MTSQQISKLFVERFGDKIISVHSADRHPRVHVDAEAAIDVLRFARDEPSLKFDWLASLSGIDYAADDKLCVAYDLWSFSLGHRFAVKAYCSHAHPHMPSVCDLWSAANWQEREAFDLLGIVFDGHPDLRRILCAEDWEGHPLRKDYVFPREYHGIPGSVELDWHQQSDYPK